MMEMRTNIVAITTNRHLVNHATQMGRGIRRVSSGFRINSAADDASGAAIANMMRSQLRGINQAIRNTQDATSMIQTADAGLHQINDMVQRIRELVVTAANDSTTIEQREMLQIEINQLTDEINAISDRTQYNSTGLLSGNTGRLSNNLRMGDNFTPFTRSLPSFYNTASLHIFQSQQAPPLPNAIVISQLDLVDGASGTGWNFTDGVLNITGIGLPDQINFQIRGTGTETDNRIVVNEGVTAGIILENVNLVSSQGPALDVRNSTVDLRLVGRSVMISNASGAAGVQTTGGDLTIHGPGSLEARGGYEEGSPLGGGAGIGGA
ncbi:MAG: flagellin, partial [Defluviitaleaceae bacterium]|nr:flagellin [Defluviitaleaceae bacterium]